MATSSARRAAPTLHDRLAGIGRAAGGALIFGLPMLMTMEMWRLGFAADRLRLALLIVAAMPLLVALSHRIGFERTFDWREDLRDALIAVAIGLVVSAAALVAFGVIAPDMTVDDLVGTLAMQTVPASLGALLGRSQFGGAASVREGPRALGGYLGQLFLMAVGALYLGLSVAPTDETMVIAFMMTPWHAVALVLASLGVMHAFVYAVAFHGGRAHATGGPWWRDALRFTLPGYAVCLLIAVWTLWSLGRLDGVGAASAVMVTVVLAFPAAVGAAAARLIL
jgi:putative integral membrane protein (TIGR02587 family)